MVALQTAFNSQTNNQTMDDFSVIPAGKYICSISKSEYVETKAKNGHYLKLTLKVLEGNFKGKTLFEQLNLINPSQVAVEIANKVLNTICKACNKANVQDSVELHGIPMEVAVKLKPATDKDPESNEITMYYSHNGTGATQQPLQTQAAPPAQTTPPVNTAPPVVNQQVQQPVQNQTAPPVQTQTAPPATTQTAPPAAETKAKLPWE